MTKIDHRKERIVWSCIDNGLVLPPPTLTVGKCRHLWHSLWLQLNFVPISRFVVVSNEATCLSLNWQCLLSLEIYQMFNDVNGSRFFSRLHKKLVLKKNFNKQIFNCECINSHIQFFINNFYILSFGF